jgi:predicted metal-dependent phosphoesterase TrpH
MFSKADTHIHTTYSDGLMSPEQTVEAIAAATDLAVIAITDHDTAEGAFVARAHARRHAPGLEVIIGQEVTTGDGDVVGLFLTASLPRFRTAAEAVMAIHAQGGLAVAVHPYSRWPSFGFMPGVGHQVRRLPFDAIEIRNGFPSNIISNPLAAWLNRASGRPLPELGGSDSHAAATVGQPYTRFPGRTAADLRRAIELGRVAAGGGLWRVPSLFRLVPLLLANGLPRRKPESTDLRPEHQPTD